MKALKIILYIVIGLVVVVAALAFIAPVKMQAERSVFIKAPKETVFANVKTFENCQKWSPWREKDTTAKVSISGTDGTVGSKFSWDGNKDMGSGEQTITKIEDNKSIESDLHFLKPWDAHAASYVHLEDSVGGTKATWGFNSEMPRPWNVMHLFMGDKMMNDEFDKGLGKLKDLTEKEAAGGVSKGYKINEITTEPKTYVGIKKTMTVDKITPFFAASVPIVVADIKKAKLQSSEPMSGLYFTFDEKTMTTDVAIAIPVSAAKGKVGHSETFSTKGGKTLEMDFYGDYKNLGKAHNKLKEYAASKNMRISMPVLEEYITDPMTEKDPNKWLTKIYYFVD